MLHAVHGANCIMFVSRAADAGDTLVYGVELIPLLIQTLEKSASQPTQVQQVTEAGAVVNLISKLLTTGHSIPGTCDVSTMYLHVCGYVYSVQFSSVQFNLLNSSQRKSQ